MITSLKQLRKAIVEGTVDEVAPNLIINFPNFNSLYAPGMNMAWVGSSATIYTLLVVNQRLKNEGLSRKQIKQNKQAIHSLDNINASDLILPNAVLASLSREVGFQFGWDQSHIQPNQKGQPFNVRSVYLGGQIGTPESDQSGQLVGQKWIALDLNQPGDNGEWVTLTGNIKSQSGQAITARKPIETFNFQKSIPTLPFYQKFINQLLSTALPRQKNAKIPDSIFDWLSDQYQYQNKTPVEIYAKIAGVKNPYQFGLGGDNSQSATAKLNGHLSSLTRLEEIPKSNRIHPNYKIARQAIKALRKGNNPVTVKNSAKLFYTGFLEKRLDAFRESPRNSKRHARLIQELGIGVRIFEAIALRSSSLNTGSNGSGYANAAHPLIGRRYEDLVNSKSLLDFYSGQEYWIDNLLLPRSMPRSALADPAIQLKSPEYPYLTFTPAQSTTPYQGDASFGGNYISKVFSKGWFRLKKLREIPQDFRGGTINEYRNNFKISDNTDQAIVLDQASLSAETITATMLSKQQAKTLHPSTEVNYRIKNNQCVVRPLEDVHRLAGKVLHQSFATYLATQGGVDRITGSDYNDVIIGPSQHNTHGMLTFEAGKGDDIVSPGRGASKGLLGLGKDIVVVSQADLHGQTILLDFNAKKDKIVIEAGILTEVNQQNPDQLSLTHKHHPQHSKTILLSGSSDSNWSNIPITTIEI